MLRLNACVIFHFGYVSVLPEYFYVYHKRAWYLQRLEENVKSSGNGAADGASPYVGAGC